MSGGRGRVPTTLADLVADLRRRPRRRAVGSAGDLGVRWVERGRLAARAEAVAAWLAGRGAGRGERFVLWGAGSPEWAAVLLGGSLAGAVPVLVDPGEPREVVERVAREQGARWVLHDADRLAGEPTAAVASAANEGRFRAAVPDASGSRASALSPTGPPASGGTGSMPATERSNRRGEAADGALEWAALTSIPASTSAPSAVPARAASGDATPTVPTAPPPTVSRDDPAVVVFSSGSTAAPRAVTLTHANLAAQLAPFLRHRRLLGTVPFRLLVLVPPSHVLGLVVGLLLPLGLGLPAVFTPALQPGRWIELVRRHRIAAVVAVPRVLELLRRAVLDSRGSSGRRLADELAVRGARRAAARVFLRRGDLFGRVPFRLFLVGGARLDEGLERFWRRAGVAVVQGYGLTETSAFVSIGRPFARRVGSLGRPVPGQEVRLGADGEIQVRGAAVAAAGERTADGFLRTGDLGRLDARGRLWFAGRSAERIVTPEGVNVDPEPVEAVLERQPGVVEAAVVAREGNGGEQVHAVLVMAPGATAGEAVRGANRELAPAQRVAGWSPWPEPVLPRTAVGKLRRREVAAWLAESTEGGRGDAAETGARSAGGEAAADGGRGHAAVPPGPTVRWADLAAEADPRRRLGLLESYLRRGVPDPDEPPGTSAAELGLGSLDLVELLGRLAAPGAAAAGAMAPVGTATPALRDAATLAALRRIATGTAGPADVSAATSRLPFRQPRYALWPPLALLRLLVRGAAVRLWSALGHRVEARWDERGGERCAEPAGHRLEPPFLLAAAPHRHWLDAFALYRALPRRLRRRVFVITNRDFREAFLPEPGTRRWQRLKLAAAYHLVMPLLFPFVILDPAGRAREGLAEAARLLDRGYSALAFPKGMLWYGMPPAERDRQDPGLARLAVETGFPLLPALLTGNEGIGWQVHRPRRCVQVRFALPLVPAAGEGTAAMVRQLEAGFEQLGLQRPEIPETPDAPSPDLLPPPPGPENAVLAGPPTASPPAPGPPAHPALAPGPRGVEHPAPGGLERARGRAPS